MTDENRDPEGHPEGGASHLAGAAGDKAQEVLKAVGKLGPQDKLIVIGSAALSILFFFPWYSVSVGAWGSSSVNGMRGVFILGFLSSLATLGAALINMRILPFPDLRPKTDDPRVMVALAGVGFFLGPLLFLLRSGSRFDGPGFGGPVQAGTTVWFWLALMAGGAMVAGAAWKFAENRNTPPMPD